jgi:hypothetical protein
MSALIVRSGFKGTPGSGRSLFENQGNVFAVQALLF